MLWIWFSCIKHNMTADESQQISGLHPHMYKEITSKGKWRKSRC